MTDIKVFDESTVKVLFTKIALMMEELYKNPPKTTKYPTSKFFHAMKGEGGQDFHFAVALLLTTDDNVAQRFMLDMNEFTKLEIGIPIQDFTKKTFEETGQ